MDRTANPSTCFVGLANFPSSAAFDAINGVLGADAKERQEAIKGAKAVFAFTLTNEGGETESWYLDLKDQGVVGKGDAPEGGKADGETHLPMDGAMSMKYTGPLLTRM